MQDFLSLVRYKDQVLSLDSALSFSQGNPAGPAALLTLLHPAKGSYTGVVTADSSQPPLLGQVVHRVKERAARLTFLMPEDAACPPQLTYLLDELICQTGEMGALNLLADIDESHPAFTCLRQAGFSVYGWQAVWKLPSSCEAGKDEWTKATPIDEIPIRNLMQSIIPPLIQTAEPVQTGHLNGWLIRREGDVVAYVQVIEGPAGIFLRPVFHPMVEDVRGLICALPRHYSQNGRSLYLAVQSYHAWLEGILAEIGAENKIRSAMLVKYLVNPVRSAVAERRAVAEKQRTQPTASMQNASRRHDG